MEEIVLGTRLTRIRRRRSSLPTTVMAVPFKCPMSDPKFMLIIVLVLLFASSGFRFWQAVKFGHVFVAFFASHTLHPLVKD